MWLGTPGVLLACSGSVDDGGARGGARGGATGPAVVGTDGSVVPAAPDAVDTGGPGVSTPTTDLNPGGATTPTAPTAPPVSTEPPPPPEPPATQFACDLSISELSINQAVRIPLTTVEQVPAVPVGDAPVADIVGARQGLVPLARTERNAAVVQGREALFRVHVEPRAGWVEREIRARLTLTNSTEVPEPEPDDGGNGDGGNGDGNNPGDNDDPTPVTPVEDTPPEFSSALFEDVKLIGGPSGAEAFESTFNFRLPPDVIGPNTNYMVELFEFGEACSGDKSNSRFPNPDVPEIVTPEEPPQELAALRALETGVLKIHLVPLISNGFTADTGEEQLKNLYEETMKNYPVTDVIFTVRAPVQAQGPSVNGAGLGVVRALRGPDNAPFDLHYYGLLRATENFGEFCNGGCTTGIAGGGRGRGGAAAGTGYGIGYVGRSQGTFVHELGHMNGVSHAPCGGPAGPDPNWPTEPGYEEAGIGTLGWDQFSEDPTDGFLTPVFTRTRRGQQEQVVRKDFMSYCGNNWVSDYNYRKYTNQIEAVNARRTREDARGGNQLQAERTTWRQLLVNSAGSANWQGVESWNTEPDGEAEVARVLSASGGVAGEVTVYRVVIADTEEAIVLVPPQEAGWSAIQIDGASVAF